MPPKSDPPADRHNLPIVQWELDGHHSNLLFKLARENAEEHIENYRLQLIELQHFDPQPQRYDYDLNLGTLGQFDQRTKEDRIADIERWIRSYELVARFCLKMEAVVAQYEAEQFGAQIVEMLRRNASQ